MVKGVTKRVVVVRCPDTRFFEQAIFMVREDAVHGVDPEKVLQEACRAADSYMNQHVREKRRISALWLVVALAVVTALGILLFFV